MAEDAVQVKGWAELAAGTEKLAGNIDTTTRDNLAAVAATVAGRVSGSVPVQSGQLAGSVTVEVGPPVSVGIGAGAASEYAGWIEFGGTRGRPYVATGRYLYPAADAAEPDVIAAAEQAATTETKGMQWPTPT